MNKILSADTNRPWCHAAGLPTTDLDPLLLKIWKYLYYFLKPYWCPPYSLTSLNTHTSLI